jgi:glyoxylase-like metal-dependent hydrolase (beta-lactamase superfamily II)
LNIEGGALSGPNPAFTRDLAQAYRSLEKLLPFPIERVLTFHGGEYRGDVRAALRTLIASGPKA